MKIESSQGRNEKQWLVSAMHDGVTQEINGDAGRRPRVDWTDPKVPVGNSPPLPSWPLWLTAAAWFAWVVFLVLMTISRYRAGAV